MTLFGNSLEIFAVALALVLLYFIYSFWQTKKWTEYIKDIGESRDALYKMQEIYKVAPVLEEHEKCVLSSLMLISNMMLLPRAIKIVKASRDKLAEIVNDPDKHLEKI